MTPAKDSPTPARSDATKPVAGAKEDSKKAIKQQPRTKPEVSTQVTPNSQKEYSDCRKFVAVAEILTIKQLC